MTDLSSSEFESQVRETTGRQAQAAAPDRSVWVSANAGTGKTKVLTDRVIRLLLSGVDPQRILCLTFTKTAAAEMATRLFDRLGRWTALENKPLLIELNKLEPDIAIERLDPARRLFARALETPGGLKIQTIHAFCQSVLDRFPLEAGVRPGSEVIDEAVQRDLLREAEIALYRRKDETLQEALKRMAIRYDSVSFSRLLRQALGRSDEIGGVFLRAGDPDGLAAYLREQMNLSPDIGPEELAEEQRATFIRLKGEIEAAIDVLLSGKVSDQKLGAELKAAVDLGEAYEGAGAYETAFFTKAGTPRKTLMTKGLGADYPDTLAFLQAEQGRLEANLQHRKQLNELSSTLDFLHLSHAFNDLYEKAKERHGYLDYDDLIRKTERLLIGQGAAAWVHFKLDGGLEHILVDEAQDTAPGQWAVIKALAEEFFADASGHETRSGQSRTVFAVGDEKQSIYSFQGARPEMFGDMQRYFAERVSRSGRAFEDVDLILSFRSTTEVLGAVDEVFARPEAAAGLTGAGDVPVHQAFRQGVLGVVELWPTVKPEETEEIDPWEAPLDRISRTAPPAVVAATIAGQIRHWIDTAEPVTPGGPAITPGDILILVQRRNSFVDEMIRALKQRDIPVAGRDRMVLADQMVVMDMMALAQFALLPEDDLTLATVLRSPFCNLSEEDLFELAHGRDEKENLWQALRRHEKDERYRGAFSELGAVLARVEVMRPFEFFVAALGHGPIYEQSGRERLLERLGPEATDPLDEFLSLALSFEHNDAPSLESFLALMRNDDAQIKRDFDHEPREVRVMTVHGAKGLEGRIVFLPDTCSLARGQGEGPLIELEGEHGPFPLFVLPKAESSAPANDVRDQRRESRMEEQRRLLYVAMTRARERLYITGYETSRFNSGCWYDLVQQALEPIMAPATRFDGEAILRLQHDHVEAAGEEARGDRKSIGPQETLPSWAKQPVQAEPPPRRMAPSRLGELLVESGESESEPPVSSPLSMGDRDRFKRGSILHKLLELLGAVAPERQEEVAMRLLGAKDYDLSPDQQNEMAHEVLKILRDPQFGSLFGPNSQPEVPLSGVLPGTDISLNGSIDRLVVEGDRIMIVDYKTNRPPPEDPEDIAPIYVTQMASYRALLSALFEGMKVEAFLLWTDGPDLMQVPEDKMDQAVARIRAHA